MKIAAGILFLVSFALLAGAAYLGQTRWQTALYLDVLAWTLTILILLSVLFEHVAPKRAAWGRAGLASLAAACAIAGSWSSIPGKVGALPFHAVEKSGLSVAALGCALGALILGAATHRFRARGPGLIAIVAMIGGVIALRGWLHFA